MQQRCACDFCTTLQRTLHMLEVIKPTRTIQIDDQMMPGKANAVAFDKEVFAVVVLKNAFGSVSGHSNHILRTVRSFTIFFQKAGNW